MNVGNKEQEIRNLLVSNGYEVVEFRIENRAKFDIVKIYVDTENGVTLDECARASRLINNYLFDEDYTGKDYRLEISSPGLDRPLKSSKDFRKQQGRQVELTYSTGDTEQTINGKIANVTEEEVIINTGSEDQSVPFTSIVKGKIVLPW